MTESSPQVATTIRQFSRTQLQTLYFFGSSHQIWRFPDFFRVEVQEESLAGARPMLSRCQTLCRARHVPFRLRPPSPGGQDEETEGQGVDLVKCHTDRGGPAGAEIRCARCPHLCVSPCPFASRLRTGRWSSDLFLCFLPPKPRRAHLPARASSQRCRAVTCRAVSEVLHTQFLAAPLSR